MVSVNIITIVIVNVTYLVVGITCPLIIIIGRKLRRPPMQWFEFGDLQHSALNTVALCSFYVLWTWMMWRWSELSSQSLSLCRERYHSTMNIVALCSCAGWILNILSLELQCCSHYKYAHCTHLNIAPKYCIVQCAELCDRSGDSARTELIAAESNRGWISRPVGQWLGQRTLQHQHAVQHCPNTQ